MSTLQGTVYGQLAVAAIGVSSIDSVPVAGYFNQRGFTEASDDNPLANGVGDVTLSLTNGVAFDNCLITTGVNDNAFAAISVEFLTTTTLRTRTCSISTATPPVVAAANLNYWITVDEFSPA